MNETTPPASPPPDQIMIDVVTSSVDAPTTFVDGIKGITVLSDVVRVAFIENRFNTLSDKVEGHHVQTLVMSKGQFKTIVEHLDGVLKDLQKQGIVA